MRAGFLISAIGISASVHAVLVLLALFGAPKLFDSTPLQSVEIELVPAEDVPPPKEEPERKKDDDKQTWGIPSPPEAAATPKPPAPIPDQSQQAALSATQPVQPAPTDTQPSSGEAKPEGSPKPAPSIFDPANIPALMDLPNAPTKGFDTEATSVANLSADERATFKAHLQKCWKPHGGPLSENTRVVVRVYLRRDASLASDPVLIEARSPRDAKTLMDGAIRAIKDCQPFAFLPAEKYGEWKVLDLSFTPRDLPGGG